MLNGGGRVEFMRSFFIDQDQVRGEIKVLMVLVEGFGLRRKGKGDATLSYGIEKEPDVRRSLGTLANLPN